MAACVNLVPGVSSIYRWRGEIQEDQEVMMIIKTVQARLAEITAWIEQNHPYDLPEVVAMPVEEGLNGYLQWVKDAVAAQD
jgi:periplasmic divalent cation tolerance protein